VTATVGLPDLGPASLDRLPAAVRRPGYDRSALRPGMAHIGVGAFHRCHQAEFTDDMLEARFDRWGIVGINLRPPLLAETLGRQAGLYTRVLRSGDARDARVIGCLLATVDAQASPDPALAALTYPAIEVATITVTEKGYCHRPATGALDRDHPDIRHDLAHPQAPRSLPGLLARALDLRRQTHGRPITLVSCDNIPGNGAILAGVVHALAERRAGLAAWIDDHAAFPSTMVDRIVPATTAADLAAIERDHGYRDAAAVGGEPFRQWVIETRFAGRTPPWDLAGAAFVADVTPFEQLKMRVLNAAQSTLAYLGVLAGHTCTCDAVADPLLEAFTRRMLTTESVPTLPPVPGMTPLAYVEQSLARLHNTAIRHRCHQIATDGSQKLPQRLINPAAERLARGQPIPRLTVAIAAWMAWLVRASGRFGRQWPAEDPDAARVAAIADRTGDDAAALTAGILSLDTVFDPALAAREDFRRPLAAALAGLLSPDPMAVVRRMEER
jgi:fructuronate reductase